MENQNPLQLRNTQDLLPKSEIYFLIIDFHMYYRFWGLNLNIFLFLYNKLFNLFGIADVEKLANGIQIASF